MDFFAVFFAGFFMDFFAVFLTDFCAVDFAPFLLLFFTLAFFIDFSFLAVFFLAAFLGTTTLTILKAPAPLPESFAFLINPLSRLFFKQRLTSLAAFKAL